MFLKPCRYDFDVEDCAFSRADGVREGLEGGGAEIVGKALEGTSGSFVRDVGARARGIGVRGGPLGVGDLLDVSLGRRY